MFVAYNLCRGDNKMVQVILTLHFYCGTEFIGQKLHWVEVTSTGALGTLIDLLAYACQPDDFHGTEQFPTDGDGFRAIMRELKQVYENPYGVNPPNWEQATSVRIMESKEGWPLEEPRMLM